MSHKFGRRQMVRLTQLGFSDAQTSTAGVYEIVRSMLADQTGELSYRISSSVIERAVRESDIRSV